MNNEIKDTQIINMKDMVIFQPHFAKLQSHFSFLIAFIKMNAILIPCPDTYMKLAMGPMSRKVLFNCCSYFRYKTLSFTRIAIFIIFQKNHHLILKRK